KNLAPAKREGNGIDGELAWGPLTDAIDVTWGSVDAFKVFNATTAGIQSFG
ncbi:hypothetical protein CERSUDRAFT_51601, partial [Gelatoporia subvermispora B]